MSNPVEHDRIIPEIDRNGSSADPFAAVVRATRTPIVITDPHQPDNPIVFANDAFCTLTGYAREEILGRNCRFMQGADTDVATVAKIAEAIDRRERIEVDLINYKKTGEAFWNRLLVAPVFDERGALTHFFSSQFNLSPEQRAAQALREKSEEFEALAENVSHLAWMAEPDGHIYWYNRRWYEYTGTDLATMQGWGWRDVHLPGEIDRISAEVAGRWAEGVSWEGIFYLRSTAGEYRPFLTRAEPIRDAEGTLLRWFGTNTDISAQLEAEHRLRDLNDTLEERIEERSAALRLYQDIVRSDTAPVCAFDTDYRLIAFNQAHSDEFFRIYGSRVAIGDVFPDLFPPDQGRIMRGFMTRALAGEVFTVTNDFGDPNLVVPHWELTYNPLRSEDGQVVGAFHHALDITERLHAETELAQVQDALRQAQKMEAVGQLTGGLAHDFNNLLTGMMGNLELLQLRVSRGRLDDLDRFINAAQGAGRRAASLTQRLLAFSRRQTLDPKPTDVNRLLAGLEEMLHRTVGATTDIELVGSAGLWTANIDAGQLENAILNLCINGRDAMPEGGKLTIETANKWIDDRIGRERDLAAGQYITVCVSDTGTGMSPETIERAFEPFYTTKPIGQGTGLGLSMIYGFAKQSGGQVRIYSEVGQGTTVCIYLPRHAGNVPDDEADEVAGLQASASAQTVLVVDDEATIRHLIDEVLDDLGYTVIGAADGAAGLKVMQSGAKIELLITDVGLPNGMNGRQVADAARALRPGLKVLFITGFAENAAVGNGHLEAGMELLTKPFTLEALSTKVAEMLSKT